MQRAPSQEQLLFPKSKRKQNKRVRGGEKSDDRRYNLPILTWWITGLRLGTGVFLAVQTGYSLTKTEQIHSLDFTTLFTVREQSA